MRKTAWVVQVLLAIVFVGAGTMKLITPREQLLANPAMAWANDFSATQIKLIGAAEVAGAAGLIAPALTGIMPVLTPVAATALALLMAGAAVTHLRRSEPYVFPLVLALLSAAVAWLRLRAPSRRG